MPPLKFGQLLVRRVLHSGCKVGKRAVELAGDDAVELAVEGVETVVQTGPTKLFYQNMGSCDTDDARPDANAPTHPQPPHPPPAALPVLDALPSNEGVLVVQLPRQLPWQRAVVHAVDVQPGDVLHDGDVLAHVLLGGTAGAPILARLHPASPGGLCSCRVQRVCLTPGDEVVAGQPVAYTAPALAPASPTPCGDAGGVEDGRDACAFTGPLQLLRQRSAALLVALQRLSSSGASQSSAAAPVALS